jgi:hypothetical protein
MKKLIFMATALLASTVMACPNLTGSYACIDQEFGNYTLEITQTGNGNKTIYTVVDYQGTEISRADGIWRASNEDGFQGKERALCSGSSLVYEMYGNADGIGKVSINAQVYLDSNDDLINVANISMGGQDFPTETQSCTRF